nr:enoyl-coa delta isomerase 3 [Quercus suber]
MTVHSVHFNSIPMWVQVWGLPFDLLSEEVGRDIGNGLGKVMEVDLKVFASDQAHFLRCGRIGHEAKECSFQVDHQQELPYGEWLKADIRKNIASANTSGGLIRREVDTHVGPSHGRISLQSDREKVSKETDSVGGVIGWKHDPVDNGVSVGGSSKGGAVFGAVEKARTVALAEKSPPDFEAIISELDKAIHSEPIISSTSSVRVEQLEDKSDFYSGLVEIEVMDADSSPNKQIPIVKNMCLQEVACNFNVGKGMGQVGSDPKVGRPKRNATKTKDAFHNVHGPTLNDSGGVTFQKSTSKEQNLLNAAGIGLKKGTWKRAQVKPRTVVEMPLYILPGPKRSNKEILCETKKADGAKKKTKQAKELWSSSKLVFPNVMDRLSSFKDMVWCLLMDKKSSPENLELLLTGAWALWGNRNEVRCGEKRKDGRMLLHWATQYLEEYRSVIVPLPVTNINTQSINGGSALITIACSKFFYNDVDVPWGEPSARLRLHQMVKSFRLVIVALLSLPIPTIAAVSSHDVAGELVLTLVVGGG